MALVTDILSILMTAYMVLVEPFVRTNFYRRLKKALSRDPAARLLYYRTQVLWELSWVVVLVIILIPIPQPLQWIGLTLPNQIGWIIMAALVVGVWLSVQLLRRSPRAMANMQHSLEASSVFLPSTAVERKWFAIMAVTAGICEELLYRGFFFRIVPTILPGFDWLMLSILSGIIYGLSRAYLGFKGISQAAITGFSFGVVYALSGSLLPAIVFHALAELRTLWLWQPEEKPRKKK